MGKAKSVNVLLVEDDKQHAQIVQSTLEKDDDAWQVTWVHSLKQARFALEHKSPDIVVTDLYLGDGQGTELLPVDPENSACPFIVMTGHGDEKTAVEIMKKGAMDYIPKSEQTLRVLGHTLRRTLRDWRSKKEAQATVQAYETQQQIYKTIFESSPIGYAVICKDGRIIDANKKGMELLGLKEPPGPEGSYHPENLNYYDREGQRVLPEDLSSAIVLKTGKAVEGRILGVQVEDDPIQWIKYSAVPLDLGQVAVLLVAADITDQVKIENELRESEKRFRDVAFAAGEYFWEMDSEGLYTFVSDRIETILGRKKEEVIGKTVFDFMPKEEVERLQDEFLRIGYKGISFKNLEHKIVWPDGRITWQRVSGEPMFDRFGKLVGYRGTAQDITELLEMRREADKQRERLFAALEGAELGLWEWNIESNSTLYDERFLQMLGYTPEEKAFDVDSWSERVHPDDIGQVLEATQKHLQGDTEIYEMEYRLKHKNGHYIWIFNAGKVVARDEEGKPVQMAGIQMDITESREVARQLREAKQRAEEADRMKSQFLANVSHEIRTPMNAILGFSDILGQEVTDARQLEYIGTISSSAQTLLKLIDDILDLSKIEAGKLELQPSEFSLSVMGREIQQMFDLKAREKKLAFSVDISDAVPEAIVGDEVRFRQVLINLVGNAIKFTKKGEVRVVLDARKNRSQPQSVDIKIKVSDTGIGIPEDQVSTIFNAFVQQKGQRNAEFGGTGLGLTITQRLVEMMGGSIKVESEKGKGSHFILMFKKVKAKKLKEKESTIKEVAVTNIRFRPATVLVVDDSPVNRSLARIYLDRLKLTCIEAENGREGIEMARKHKPDIILLDMVMPVLDGMETIKILKAHKDLSKIPVISLTASAMKGTADKMLSAGYSGYLKKPTSLEDFVKELARLLPYDDATMLTKDTGQEIEKTGLGLEDSNWQELDELKDIALEERWKELQETLYVDEIKTFAQDLMDIGDRNKHKALTQWATTLHQQASQFDVKRLPGTLAYFGDILEEVRRQSDDR